MDIVATGMTGNVQRIFRARHKLHEPGLISHITQRAAGREPLFLEDGDFLTMLGLLKESAEKFSLSYYALCLMNNHVHLLVMPREKNLAEAMRSIFSRYAAKFNRRYERRGHLFGGPYRQSVCLDTTYLLAASAYIHLNPVRAGLVEDANAYRWSSSSLYCRKPSGESFIDPQPVLGLVHDNMHSARKIYGRLLQKARSAEPENALEHEGAVEKFCVRLADHFPGLFRSLVKKAAARPETPSLLELTELEKRLRDLDRSRARSAATRKEKKYIAQQLAARGFQKTEIAQRLGVSRRAIYYLLHSQEG